MAKAKKTSRKSSPKTSSKTSSRLKDIAANPVVTDLAAAALVSAAAAIKNPPEAQARAAGAQDELTALGITWVQTKTFEWGGYRYTNAQDAIAAAKRAALS